MNRNQLKYIAAAAMLTDHAGMFFVPITNPIGLIMRIIGRLTAPIMCMFLAEGYFYTSSKKKYGIRLFVFAVISQFAYAFSHENPIYSPNFNMIFTLFLCFLILLSNEKIENAALKTLAIFALTAVSIFSDWGIIAPLWVLAFYLYKDDTNRKTLLFCLIAAMHVLMSVIFSITNGYNWYGELWQLGVYLFVPLMFLYNGKSGKNTAFSKWFFYVFYPLHLIVLGAIQQFII